LGQRPQLTVEFSPVELAWLEILVGSHAIDSFAQFVEIANGMAVAIGIKKSLHRLSHNSEFFDGRLILVAVQAFQIIPGSGAVFRRRSSASADAYRKSPVLIKGQSLLEPNVQRPIGREVVFIAKALAAMQTKTNALNSPINCANDST